MMENFKLRVFRVAADTLNFRRAADELHLTQPAALIVCAASVLAGFLGALTGLGGGVVIIPVR